MALGRWPTGRARRSLLALAAFAVTFAPTSAAGGAPLTATAPDSEAAPTLARAGASGAVSTASASASPRAVDGLIPISPSRVFDTRVGEPARVNRGAALAPQETVTVDVASVLNAPIAEVAGVALNVTVDGPVAAGYLTVWPDGTRPVASTVNFRAGQTVPNGAIVGIDAAGQVRIFNGSVGAVHVIVDVNGWIPTGSGFVPITPVRALETRSGEPGYAGVSRLGPDGTVTVDVGSLLPAADRARATAVTVNLTAVTGTAAESYLTAYPAGATLPATSSVNFRRAEIVPNSAVLGLGTAGKVTIYNHVGSVDVVLDVTGYFVDGRTFRGLAPDRLVDTRESTNGPLGSGEIGYLKIDRNASLPRGFVGSVAVNVTVASATASGYLTVWPASSDRPTASSVNFTAGRIVANTVIVGVDEDSYLAVFNSAGRTDVVIDITGWFPQDAIGLISDGREARRYSLGTDRLGYAACQPSSGTQTDVAAAFAKLADATPYYTWLSGGRYTPQFVNLGAGAYNGLGVPLAPCNPSTAAPSDLRGMLYSIPADFPATAAAGVAGPGNRCGNVDCSLDTSWPDNRRSGRFTANSLDPPAGVTAFFSVPVHEMGHMLDWPHSYTGNDTNPQSPRPDGVWEYDDPTDIMSSEPRPNDTDQPRFAETQASLAINRYAAGWVDPSLVTVHSGGPASYALVAKGGAAVHPDAKELLILPSSDPAAYVTAEVRVKSASWDPKMADYDGKLLEEGVVLHVVDQRAGVGCPAAQSSTSGLDRCSGLGRRTQPFGAVPMSYAAVVKVGQTVNVDSMTFAVTAAADGQYQVTVGGGPIVFDPIAYDVVGVGVLRAVADDIDQPPVRDRIPAGVDLARPQLAQASNQRASSLR